MRQSARLAAATLVLHVANPPRDDQIEITIRAWAEIFRDRLGGGSIEEIDGERLEKAWRAWAAGAKFWPTPAEILEHLPPRPRRLQIARSIGDQTDDEIAAGKAALDKINEIINCNNKKREDKT
ncbi:hypothetical protein [Trichloromonas sp.]|uniref:hypothetical protein n=1 Tax=Trichloromonas sp. TaxID=3069249 RepID=UPI002A45E5C7|nr:hypothetical protein [Trichloromonas sp.]